MLRRLVVGYDFSEAADDAMAWAADLAHQCGAHLSAVHVARDRAEDDPALAELRARLAVATQDLHDVSTHVLAAGDVAGALVAFADETDADLLVVATASVSAMRRLVLGSVADDVLRRAHCPVVTWRADDG